MVLGISWGELALILGASAALFGGLLNFALHPLAISPFLEGRSW